MKFVDDIYIDMIAGIGIDLVHIPRMEKLLKKWGMRFKQRVFTGREITYSESHVRYEQHFAGNFAVKESFVKALGKEQVRFLDIEILRDENGKPYINLHGRAKAFAERNEIRIIHTSITHDGEYSMAAVVLER